MVSRLARVTVGGVPRVIDLLRGFTVTSNPSARTGYLPNPGMGFQGYVHATAKLPEMVEYRRSNTVNQGGFDWASMNPTEGVYDFGNVDTLLAACDARGDQGSFRVVTVNGDGFGGHCVPDWVVADGCVVLAGDEPDYRCRAYQQHWGTFVDALAAHCDGDERLAFVDISGYGKFNEWQAYEFTQTGGDDFEGNGTSIDAFTRRHLVHMFVGGAGTSKVVEADGVTEGTLDYDHPGFQQTQLIMTYGGQWSSTRWVATNFPHVGFRNDALFGPDAELADFSAIGYGVTDIWQTAPVMFEPISGTNTANYPAGATAMQGMHATLLHDNSLPNDAALAALVAPLGYRYACDLVTVPAKQSRAAPLRITSRWRNVGLAPAYPRMGQAFALEWSLADSGGDIVKTARTGEVPHEWMPQTPQNFTSELAVSDVPAGDYLVLAGIVDLRTGQLINLGSSNGDVRDDRRLPVGSITLT